ncbi:hypothetical protein SAMN02745129_2546 [Ferrimonas marina]|uniref:Uncharacterized protein n=2 Tax=Ferrimonas marina TaxID=299255 RepID=A0A1M5UFC1_9GAMM|nr:hypothetical protein SAMN02745129_2546 [Ferrimonas marina]
MSGRSYLLAAILAMLGYALLTTIIQHLTSTPPPKSEFIQSSVLSDVATRLRDKMQPDQSLLSGDIVKTEATSLWCIRGVRDPNACQPFSPLNNHNPHVYRIDCTEPKCRASILMTSTDVIRLKEVKASFLSDLTDAWSNASSTSLRTESNIVAERIDVLRQTGAERAR